MPERDPRAERLAALLADRYELLEFLGQGGFAAVYKVRSRSLDRLEALKVLHTTHEDDTDFAERFQHEARVAAGLDHPNIVRIHDFGRAEELFWYSMQFVDGPTLTRALATGGPMDERRAAALAAALCDALAYAHERGIVHRDVKPDNVILGPAGRPYLMDFGIAKSANSLVKTQSGLILGSPAFLSPEQVRGEPPDGRSDIYSLAIALYQMVSGKRPFTAEDRTVLMVMRLREDPVPLAEARPGLEPGFAALVMRCLSRDKTARPAAAELRDQLLAFLDGTGGRPLASRLSGEAPVPAKAPAESALPASDTTPTRRDTAPADREGIPTVALRQAPPPVPPPVPSAAPLPAPTPLARPRRALLVVAAGILTAAGALLVGRVALRRAAPVPVATPVPAPAPAPRPAAAPTAAPIAAPAPTPAPVATTTPKPAIAPSPVPERPRATPHAARPAREEPAPASLRRAVVPAEILEQVPVKLPADVASEYAGRSVGLKVTIGEDGDLKNARIAIPVDPPCAACDAAALEAVKRFRFAPAKDRDGNPVESSFGVAVRF